MPKKKVVRKVFVLRIILIAIGNRSRNGAWKEILHAFMHNCLRTFLESRRPLTKSTFPSSKALVDCFYGFFLCAFVFLNIFATHSSCLSLLFSSFFETHTNEKSRAKNVKQKAKERNRFSTFKASKKQKKFSVFSFKNFFSNNENIHGSLFTRRAAHGFWKFCFKWRDFEKIVLICFLLLMT